MRPCADLSNPRLIMNRLGIMHKNGAFDLEHVKNTLQKLLKGGGITDARKLYEETLFEWGDEYSRIVEESPDLSIEVKKWQ